MTFHQQHQYIRLHDITIHALVAGEGDPVLLVHGFPDDHSVWAHRTGCNGKRRTG